MCKEINAYSNAIFLFQKIKWIVSQFVSQNNKVLALNIMSSKCMISIIHKSLYFETVKFILKI